MEINNRIISQFNKTTQREDDVPILNVGCTDIYAVNYSQLANSDDGSCIYPTQGQTVVAGDINNDGELNILDIVEIINSIENQEEPGYVNDIYIPPYHGCDQCGDDGICGDSCYDGYVELHGYDTVEELCETIIECEDYNDCDSRCLDQQCPRWTTSNGWYNETQCFDILNVDGWYGGMDQSEGHFYCMSTNNDEAPATYFDRDGCTECVFGSDDCTIEDLSQEELMGWYNFGAHNCNVTTTTPDGETSTIERPCSTIHKFCTQNIFGSQDCGWTHLTLEEQQQILIGWVFEPAENGWVFQPWVGNGYINWLGEGFETPKEYCEETWCTNNDDYCEYSGNCGSHDFITQEQCNEQYSGWVNNNSGNWVDNPNLLNGYLNFWGYGYDSALEFCEWAETGGDCNLACYVSGIVSWRTGQGNCEAYAYAMTPLLYPEDCTLRQVETNDGVSYYTTVECDTNVCGGICGSVEATSYCNSVCDTGDTGGVAYCEANFCGNVCGASDCTIGIVDTYYGQGPVAGQTYFDSGECIFYYADIIAPDDFIFMNAFYLDSDESLFFTDTEGAEYQNLDAWLSTKDEASINLNLTNTLTTNCTNLSINNADGLYCNQQWCQSNYTLYDESECAQFIPELISTCTTSTACNYNAACNDSDCVDDGSCVSPPGNQYCYQDSDEDGNYTEQVLVSLGCGGSGDGDVQTCEDLDYLSTPDTVLGCNNPDACNYDPLATVKDDSCIWCYNGGTDSLTNEEACAEYPNDLYDCNGSCLVDVDCNGDCGGVAVYDCNDDCGGSAIVLECYSDSDGDGLGSGAVIHQCSSSGSCEKGLVDAAGDPDPNCPVDATYDCDGNCCDDGKIFNTENPCLVNDECGVCDGDGIPHDLCSCFGIPPLENYNCVGECIATASAGQELTDGLDCAGVCNGIWTLDECGICGGGGTISCSSSVDHCSTGTDTYCPNIEDENSAFHVSTCPTVDECGDCNGGGAAHTCWDNSTVCSEFYCPCKPPTEAENITWLTTFYGGTGTADPPYDDLDDYLDGLVDIEIQLSSTLTANCPGTETWNETFCQYSDYCDDWGFVLKTDITVDYCTTPTNIYDAVGDSASIQLYTSTQCSSQICEQIAPDDFLFLDTFYTTPGSYSDGSNSWADLDAWIVGQDSADTNLTDTLTAFCENTSYVSEQWCNDNYSLLTAGECVTEGICGNCGIEDCTTSLVDDWESECTQGMVETNIGYDLFPELVYPVVELSGGYSTDPLARNFISYPMEDKFYDRLGIGNCNFFVILENSLDLELTNQDFIWSDINDLQFNSSKGPAGWTNPNSFNTIPKGIGFILSTDNPGTLQWSLPSECEA